MNSLSPFITFHVTCNVVLSKMSSEVNNDGHERSLSQNRGNLLQLSSKVNNLQQLMQCNEYHYLSHLYPTHEILIQEDNEYGRGRLLQMSQLRHGGSPTSHTTENVRKPRSILVLRWDVHSRYLSIYTYSKYSIYLSLTGISIKSRKATHDFYCSLN